MKHLLPTYSMNQEETYDALFAEYTKGVLSIDRILCMFEIDPVEVAARLRANGDRALANEEPGSA